MEESGELFFFDITFSARLGTREISGSNREGVTGPWATRAERTVNVIGPNVTVGAHLRICRSKNCISAVATSVLRYPYDEMRARDFGPEMATNYF